MVYTPTLWREVRATLPLYSPPDHKPMYDSIVRRGISKVRVCAAYVIEPPFICLSEIMSNVKCLELDFCYELLDHQTDNVLGLGVDILFEKSLPLLTHIECFFVHFSLLKLISEQCYNLECLKVEEVVGNFSFSDFAKLFVNLKNLSFELVDNHINGKVECDAALQCLSGQTEDPAVVGCLKLEELSLYGDGWNVTDNGMKYLSTGLHVLKILTIVSDKVTDEGLKILTKIKTLEELTIFGSGLISDTGLYHLSNGAAKLVMLSVHDTKNVTDKGIQYLASIKTLKSLELDGLYKISDTSFLHLAKGEARLSYLSFNMYNDTDRGIITDTGMQYILEAPGLLGLQTFKFCNWGVSDEFLLKMVSALKCLNKLYVSRLADCEKRSLSKNFPYLKVKMT